MVASATVEQEILGSILGSGKVLFGFSVRNFAVTVTESGFVDIFPVDDNKLAPYYMGLKNITGEMWVYY